MYRSKIMLYVLWRYESSDLGGYIDFRSHYEDKMTFWTRSRSILNATEIDEAINDLTEHGPPQHAWDQVLPSNKKQREMKK